MSTSTKENLTPTDFSEFLSYMRKGADITVSAMAKSLGVDRRTLRRWESGECLSTRDLYDLEQKVRQAVKEKLSKR